MVCTEKIDPCFLSRNCRFLRQLIEEEKPLAIYSGRNSGAVGARTRPPCAPARELPSTHDDTEWYSLSVQPAPTAIRVLTWTLTYRPQPP